MSRGVNVPVGQALFFLAGEIRPLPGDDEPRPPRDELVVTVAVSEPDRDGRVQVDGHICTRTGPVECGTEACFSALVAVAAVQANLDGYR